MKILIIFLALAVNSGCGGMNGKPSNSEEKSENPPTKEASMSQGTCKNLELPKGTYKEIAVQMNRIRINCQLSIEDADKFAARYREVQ